MKRENIEGALALSKRLVLIDAQIERLGNVQSGTGMRIGWGYQHGGSELTQTDVSREEAIGMMVTLRDSVIATLRELGVSDAA